MATKADQMNIEELLCVEGIMSKGYGCVAKYAMHDQDLDIQAKGLYAYLCSLTGGGMTTWPLRTNVLMVLQINKTTYYKALNALKEAGYITVTRKYLNGQSNRNVYTIVSNPKRFTENLSEEADPQLRYQGMLSAGFGMIPRLVMQDQRLSLKEKALYAYMVCYANAGSAAFPKVDTIKYHLQIGDSSYQKYMRTLQALGYIEKQQRRIGGRFGVFDYYLSAHPSVLPSDITLSDIEKWDIGVDNSAEPTPEAPQPVLPDIEKWDIAVQNSPDPAQEAPHPVSPDIEKWDIGLWDSDSLDNHYNNTSTIHSQSLSTPKEEDHPPLLSESENFDAPEPQTSETGNTRGQSALTNDQATALDQATLRTAMLEARGIPTSLLGHSTNMTAALRMACDFHPGDQWSTNPQEQQEYETVFEALRLMCCRPMTKVREGYIHNSDVVSLLNEYAVMLPYRPELAMVLEYLVEVYHTALQERRHNDPKPLKYPTAYAKYVIWDALQTYEVPREFGA